MPGSGSSQGQDRDEDHGTGDQGQSKDKGIFLQEFHGHSPRKIGWKNEGHDKYRGNIIMNARNYKGRGLNPAR